VEDISTEIDVRSRIYGEVIDRSLARNSQVAVQLCIAVYGRATIEGRGTSIYGKTAVDT
jgi:hypothetical protein